MELRPNQENNNTDRFYNINDPNFVLELPPEWTAQVQAVEVQRLPSAIAGPSLSAFGELHPSGLTSSPEMESSDMLRNSEAWLAEFYSPQVQLMLQQMLGPKAEAGLRRYKGLPPDPSRNPKTQSHADTEF